MQIQIKRVRPGAILPTYGSEMAAGMDLYAYIEGGVPLVIYPQEAAFLIPTGIAIHIGDPNYVAMVYPRSGLGHKKGLVLGNGSGVVDPDYQGEMFVSAWNRNPPRHGHDKIVINHGDRIAQVVFQPIVRVKFEVVEEFSAATSRGAGGWGSTGGAGALEKAVVAAGVDPMTVGWNAEELAGSLAAWWTRSDDRSQRRQRHWQNNHGPQVLGNLQRSLRALARPQGDRRGHDQHHDHAGPAADPERHP